MLLVAKRIRFGQKFGHNLVLLLLNIFCLFIVFKLEVEGGLPLIGNANSIKRTLAILIDNFGNTAEAHSVIAWQLAWLFHLRQANCTVFLNFVLILHIVNVAQNVVYFIVDHLLLGFVKHVSSGKAIH